MTVQETYKKIMSSEELKKKGIEALKQGKADEFLKENGFGITVEQINDYVKRKNSGELTKAELDLAAGGCDEPTPCDIALSITTVGIGCAIQHIRF